MVLGDLDIMGHEEGRDLLVLPDAGLARPWKLCSSLDVWHVEAGVFLLLLDQRAQVETEL